jgi:hypothetical protein
MPVLRVRPIFTTIESQRRRPPISRRRFGKARWVILGRTRKTGIRAAGPPISYPTLTTSPLDREVNGYSSLTASAPARG